MLKEMLRSFARSASRGTYYSKLYKVRGVNPDTKRKKTVEVVAASDASEEVVTGKSGLLPPFEVMEGVGVPDEGQLNLAKKYGVNIPSDADAMDARLLLQRCFDGVASFRPITGRVIDYAIENNVYIPKYASLEEARDFLLEYAPEKEKEIKELCR